jgi:hypothetical protein
VIQVDLAEDDVVSTSRKLGTYDNPQWLAGNTTIFK